MREGYASVLAAHWQHWQRIGSCMMKDIWVRTEEITGIGREKGMRRSVRRRDESFQAIRISCITDTRAGQFLRITINPLGLFQAHSSLIAFLSPYYIA